MVQRLSRARVGVAAIFLARLWLGGLRVPSARAQAFDCEDVDHDCDPADKTVARGIKRTGADLVDCVRHAVNPCDLTSALARVNDPQCAAAIECEVRGLFAEVGDGSTSCVQRLFKEGYRFMAKKVTLLRHNRLEPIVDDLARCKERGGRLYVWPKKAHCCGGLVTLATSTTAPRREFRRVAARSLRGGDRFLASHAGNR